MKRIILFAAAAMALMAFALWVWAVPAVPQVAKLVDYTNQENATFSLGANDGGTYKYQFVEVVDNVWPSYDVIFFQDGNWYASSGPVSSTTPDCYGALTVYLAGGHSYTMRIDYAIGGGHYHSGLIAKAIIFYQCSSQ